jgi:hypothetical protein
VSFLLDPPALYAAGEAYARTVPESAQGRTAGAVGAGAVGALLGIAVSFWLDLPWTRPFWRAVGAYSGPDAQVGTGLFHLRSLRRPGSREHALAAVGFLAYPLAWWLGWDHGRRARP